MKQAAGVANFGGGSNHELSLAGGAGAGITSLFKSLLTVKSQKKTGKEWASARVILDAAKDEDELAKQVLDVIYINTNMWGQYKDMEIRATVQMFTHLRSSSRTTSAELPPGVEPMPSSLTTRARR